MQSIDRLHLVLLANQVFACGTDVVCCWASLHGLCTCVDASLCRTGPAHHETSSSACRFDGTAMMHKFEIEAGHVTYRNRHLVKEMENYIREYNRSPSMTACEDPCGSLMGRAFSTFVQAGVLLR